MGSEFILSITLGNDAMRDGSAIAAALRQAAEKIDCYYGGTELPESLAPELIRDANGARVGQWGITE